MSVSLKLASLNVERSKHLDTVLPFLRSQKADVVCLQECMERDADRLEEAFGGESFFTPLIRYSPSPDEKEGLYGMAILSKLPVITKEAYYYSGEFDPQLIFDGAAKGEERIKSIRRTPHALVSLEVEKEDISFSILNTHFTWTPDGKPDDLQRRDMKSLLELLAGQKEFVLAGDFNAPRGGEMWKELADRYKDNVPERYTTSIDGDLHIKGQLNLMVDGIFSTPEYTVSDLEMFSGISDHCALVATVSKTG